MTHPIKPIPFIDLASQQQQLRQRIDARIAQILDHGQYIMGPEVAVLEGELAQFCGASHAISCSSGTDALMLGLMALGVKPNDGVIVPSFSFAATAEVLPCLGAVPIFADIDPSTFNLDVGGLDNALAAAHKAGIEVVGIITVGLFGQPSNMDAINACARGHSIWVMDDAAQSFGASWGGAKTGTMARITTTSFFPAKPLGCYGDGGAVFTDDEALAQKIRSLRVHGMGKAQYQYEHIGMTARMDTLQAAILLEKLTIFADELDRRNRIAQTYAEGLKAFVTPPELHPSATSSWAQYCIKLPPDCNRAAVQNALKAQGIPTAIYYPLGIHQQAPYSHFPIATGGLPVTLDCSNRTLALPMHPYLDEATQTRIITAVGESLG